MEQAMVSQAMPSSAGCDRPPSVFTEQVRQRLAQSNAAARALREMGYQVMAEDPIPKDAGRPILLLDLNAEPAERLLKQCHASTRRPGSGRVTAHFMEVRIIFQQDREDAPHR